MNKIVCVILLFFIFDCNCHVIEDEHPERVLPAPPECGLPSSLAKRSVGGGPTVVSNFPWTVFLIYDNGNDIFVSTIACTKFLLQM